jgi:DNA replication and repair protein RecF
VFLSRLSLENFRNFTKKEFHFENGINVLWGKNATGKSNLIEAIYFSLTGKPSRAGKEDELIQFSLPYARIETCVEKKKKKFILEASLERIEGNSTRKILKLNRNPIRRVSELMGEFKAVLFSPQDQSLVQGEPFYRRRFLDFMLCQTSKMYLHSYMKYQGVKDQRNSLLKQTHSSAELFPWNSKLIESGSQLLLKRLEILPELSVLSQKAHHFLCQSESLELQYLSSFPLPEQHKRDLETIQESFEKALAETAQEEKKRGITLVGPHRDDMKIFINNLDARLFASQGQQKTAALSMRLAEGMFFEKMEEEPPVYLLDDCFSELDSDRQHDFCDFFFKNTQTILTLSQEPTPDLKLFPSIKLTNSGKETVTYGISG